MALEQDMEAEVRYVEAMLQRQRPGADLDWDAEFAELHAYTQRLRERTIAMLTSRMEQQTQPYLREHYRREIDQIRRRAELDDPPPPMPTYPDSRPA